MSEPESMRSAVGPHIARSFASSWAARFSSVARWNERFTVRAIPAGSRPTFAHQSSSTRESRANSPGETYAAFQPSA
jgi:hypothetical protein